MNREENIDFKINVDMFDFNEKVEYAIFSCIILVSGILIRVYQIGMFTGNLLIVGGSILFFVTLIIVTPYTKNTKQELEEKERRILSYSRWLNSTKNKQELEEVKRKLATVIKAKEELPRVIEEKKEECEQILEEYIEQQEEKIKELVKCPIEELRKIKKSVENEIEIQREIHKRAREEEYGEYKIQSILKTEKGELIIFAETKNKEDIHFFVSNEDLTKQLHTDTIESLF